VTRYRSFRKKRSFLLPGLIVLAALLLTYYSLPYFGAVRILGLTLLYPFQYSAGTAWNFTVGLPKALIGLRDLSAENSRLNEQLSRQSAELAQLAELKTENEQLRGDLGFARKGNYGGKLIAAQIIAKSGSPWPGVIEISGGGQRGFRVNMPVVAGAGLVGKIIEVAPLSAKVLLITDPLSSVAAAAQRSRDQGVVEGYSPDTLNLKYLGTGIPIGAVVSSVKNDADLFYQIKVKPAVDFYSLEQVFVVD
jgi:rod shape-determining protein MreC